MFLRVFYSCVIMFYASGEFVGKGMKVSRAVSFIQYAKFKRVAFIIRHVKTKRFSLIVKIDGVKKCVR